MSWGSRRRVLFVVLGAGVALGMAAPVGATGSTATSPATASSVSPTPQPSGSELAPEGRPIRLGERSRVLDVVDSRTSSTTSLTGDTTSTPQRVVGSLEVAGGAASIPDAAAAAVSGVADRTWRRHGGADRYAVAVELSRRGFPDGADVVFVATGENWPDGLSASAVAGNLGGPVLLTRAGSVSAATLSEIARLAPRRIHVVGGPASVSDAVLARLATAAPAATVSRVGGLDRYAVAVNVGKLLTTTSASAFVATGETFPDALSGGPAAARQGAPVLLTKSTGLSAATKTELARRRPATTYVLGGAASVPDAVVAAIRSATGGSVVRLGGADRYAVAETVSRRFNSGLQPHVTLATGVTFSDALGAGALAARLGGPLLLASDRAVPPRVTVDEAKRLSWFVPESGRVMRFVVIAHPDDEMSIRAVLGPSDPGRYDVYVLLTQGERTSYCTGLPVSNAWVDQEYLPQPQPTGVRLSERCHQHRLDSWDTFLSRTSLSPSGTTEVRSGREVVVDGAPLPAPTGLDAAGSRVVRDTFEVTAGKDSAKVVFDLGNEDLTNSEVIWAVENALDLREELSPGALEGDIVGAGYVNQTTVGYSDLHPDHVAVMTVMGSFDFGLPGSQYHPVGHNQPSRAVGAWDADYCAQMCHPSGVAPWVGPMGDFQYSYGWLAAGRWRAGTVDAPAGFSQYQSFAKWF
ncbi:MAG TPA: cell wall-binding repeat-containing protein [Ornithinibacter sp.]|nr:cell wall-binding repeat-containing protein [Ornithinibacter sp.]